MERTQWLRQMRARAEAVYDHFSPLYWVSFGLYANEAHRAFLQRFLERLAPRSALLSAACGAGRYDGMLLAAGHSVVGIDQSEGMLARARERFPGVRYEKIALQEMQFQEAFDGATCIDAMEHVCPEDWPDILRRFREALRPAGVLYFTVDQADAGELEEAYQRATSQGLPVVYGELVDETDRAFQHVMALGASEPPGEWADKAAYHFYPPLEQVRSWIEQAGFVIEDEGTGSDYAHLLVRKRPVQGLAKIADGGKMPPS